MATTNNANQFSKTKKEITLKDNNSEKNVTIRKRPFEKHKEKDTCSCCQQLQHNYLIYPYLLRN